MNNEELIQMAFKTAQKGQKESARMMLMQVYNRDKNNERVMLGMAQLAGNADERRKWLKLLLKKNPNHEKAQGLLKKLDYKSAAKQNRTLLIWGTLIAVLFILVLAVVILVLAS